jgi:hypothetical protein
MKRYCNRCGIEVEFTEYNDGNHVAWGNSHVEARDNSHVVAWGNSHVEACGNSHVEACGNSHVEACGNSHVECRSPYACALLRQITATGIGNVFGNTPIEPEDYLSRCGVAVVKGKAILYKSVQADGTSSHSSNIKYPIGKRVIASDWDATSVEECGKGLHLSPTVRQAVSFNDAGHYLACRVDVKDMASLPAFAQYPDKIRVRACVPLCRCDIDGNRQKAAKRQTK